LKAWTLSWSGYPPRFKMLPAPFSVLLRRTLKITNAVITAPAPKHLMFNADSFPLSILHKTPYRLLTTTAPLRLKEIVETIDRQETVVEGVKVDIPRGCVVKIQDADGTLRSIFDDREFWRLLSHTDVLILRQFLNTDYTVLPIEVTGLKPFQQDRIEQLVRKAQRANLIPMKVRELKDTVPFTSELKYGDYDHKKYNSYYDDWDKIY